MLRLSQTLRVEVLKVLCLPRTLPIEVHQVLCLSRTLRIEVRKVLCLPRNQHFEVHQLLHLPRNLHFEVHQVLCLPRNLHFEVHQVLCLPRNLHFKVHQVLRLPQNLHANEPHVQKPRFTAPVTKSELLNDHHHVQSAAPATKTAVRSKTAPIPCTSHEKSTLDHEDTRFPLHLPRKRARHHNESAVVRSTRRGPSDFASLRRVEVHRLGPSWMVFLSELKGIIWEMLNGFSVGRHLVHDAPPPLPDPGALLVEVANCQREAANCQQYLVAWALNLDAMSGLQFQAALGGAVEACGSLLPHYRKSSCFMSWLST